MSDNWGEKFMKDLKLTKEKKRKPLIFQILRLCGVKDLEDIVDVKLHATTKEFNIEVTHHSRGPDDKHIVSDNALVTHTNKYTLVEIKELEISNVGAEITLKFPGKGETLDHLLKVCTAAGSSVVNLERFGHMGKYVFMEYAIDEAWGKTDSTFKFKKVG